MFTGLVENIGIVKSVVPKGNYREITISPQPMFDEVQHGESIAVSGTCLTVTKSDNNGFTADVSQETLKLTTIGSLKPGGQVNLERALRANSRLGGHFVAGHVDCVSRILEVKDVGQSRQLEIELLDDYGDLVIDKGSIALDGVSLTIINVRQNSIKVNLIPETKARTTLGNLTAGELINIEFDLIGKYILRFLELRRRGSKLSLEDMRNMGY